MNPIRHRDPEAPPLFERSTCCCAEISWGRTRAGQTSPPEPIASCSACGGRCDTIQITEEEEEKWPDAPHAEPAEADNRWII